MPSRRKKRNNNNSNPASPPPQHDALTLAFHKYLCENDEAREKATNRDGTHNIFVEFFKAQPNETGPPPKRLEALVMARLRQRRLMKSKRYGSQVMVIFADKDRVFPPFEERISMRDRFLQQRQELEADKHGVSVFLRQEELEQTMELGSTASFHVFVKYNFEEANDNEPTKDIELESITLSGPHRDHYKLSSVPFTLPWSVRKDPATRGFVLTSKPKYISLFRCCVKLNFTLQTGPKDRLSFSIAKYIVTKGTMDAALEKALSPTTPYTKKVKKDRNKQVEEVIGPEDDKGDDEDNNVKGQRKKKKKETTFNPLKELPSYKIPFETRDLLQANEMETILEQPRLDSEDDGEEDACSIVGYASFWENILWASEHQAHRDIELFDMENIALKPEAGFYLLTVPGLAESRPSVLFGDLVRIYWGKRMFLGKVNQVRLLEVRLKMHPSFQRSFNASVDRVDVRFCLSRTTFRTSHYGVAQAETNMKALMLLPNQHQVAKAKEHSETRPVASNKVKWANRFLNPEQQRAVLNVIQGTSRPLPYCIFGPPGTGKTTTVVEAVYQLVKKCQAKVLLVAPSNDAVDVLTERLSAFYPPTELKRVLAYSRNIDMVPSAIRDYVVETKTDDSGLVGNDKKQKEHAQCRDIKSGRIVVATVNLAARFSWMGVPRGHFDVLCVDEAGHATEPEVVAVASTLMNFYKGEDESNSTGQILLAGDPRQLGPVVTSEICRRNGLEVSYMERLMQSDVYGRNRDGDFPPELVTKLVSNYRSHPSIIKLPNEMFYDGELQCKADPLVSHNLSKWEHLPIKGFPVMFHAIDGENLREGTSPSWFNPQEVCQTVAYVKLLTKDTRPPLSLDDIGIITPYHRQAQKIRMVLELESISGIKVGSVETFQGQERRCVIVSTVRADAEHVESDLRYNLGFVANEKRFNVAVTRSKALLVVIGCPSVLALDTQNWRPFLEYCHENKAWAGADWDPSQADEESELIELVQKENNKKNDKEHGTLGEVDSEAAAEEGFAFVNREE